MPGIKIDVTTGSVKPNESLSQSQRIVMMTMMSMMMMTRMMTTMNCVNEWKIRWHNSVVGVDGSVVCFLR